MAGLPSGTVTLLFSDIEGSTRLLERLGDAYADTLAEHRRLVREAVRAHGGMKIDTQGDAFFCAFARVRDAVGAAIEAQRTLSATPVRVRIGIHTGEPTRTEEGYVGLDVHRAARIGAAANGGQVLVSESTRSLVGEEIGLRDLGEYRLVGLDRPERLYQVVAAGLASEFEPPRAQARARSRRERLRTPDDLTKVAWRVHDLGKVAPSALSRPLEALAGAVLGATRVVSAVDHTLEAVDRDEHAARLADYQRRSSAAPHVAQAAVELDDGWLLSTGCRSDVAPSRRTSHVSTKTRVARVAAARRPASGSVAGAS
jgi:class 3 adenylate cyclase